MCTLEWTVSGGGISFMMSANTSSLQRLCSSSVPCCLLVPVERHSPSQQHPVQRHRLHPCWHIARPTCRMPCIGFMARRCRQFQAVRFRCFSTPISWLPQSLACLCFTRCSTRICTVSFTSKRPKFAMDKIRIVCNRHG